MLGHHAISDAPLSSTKETDAQAGTGAGSAVSIRANMAGGTGSIGTGSAISIAYDVVNPQNRIELIHNKVRKGGKPKARGRTLRLDGALFHIPEPVPSPALLHSRIVKGGKPKTRGKVRWIRPHMIDWARRYATGRGQYRVFNASEYRFYRTDGSAPAESDSPYATSSSLPDTPVTAFADGDWHLSVSFFNGVMDSGFLPLGANGETWVRVPLTGGAETGIPPQAPTDIRLSQEASGVVRVFAFYFEAGTLRADTWGLGVSYDGSTPAVDTPTDTATMVTQGVAVLTLALPGQANGTTVKVRTQVRRGSVYSENSSVLTTTADASGPAAPAYGESWPGSIAEQT